jgi:isocitrate lyase
MTTPAAEQLRKDWQTNPRWKGVTRPYKAEDVVRLRGSVHIEHSLARLGAEKLWKYVNEKPFVNALGALTGNQAMQQVRAGLDAIYLSGWQVAGDANVAGQMYPDQSLYPSDSVPNVVRRINGALRRADEIHHAEGQDTIDWLKPIVADAEAGFGGVLNAFELMKQPTLWKTPYESLASGAALPSPFGRWSQQRHGSDRPTWARSTSVQRTSQQLYFCDRSTHLKGPHDLFG